MVDAANYVGPVKVASIKDKGGGRGLVATRDIQDGEILLAVKAIALVSVTEVPSSRPIVAFNLEEGVVDTSNLVLYTQSVLYRLMDQPELAPKVYDLYLGPNSPAETPADFPLAPIEGQPPAIDVTAPCRLDPDAIARAAYWNASTPFRVLPVPVSGDLLTYGSEETPGALYAESAMSKSCRAPLVLYFANNRHFCQSTTRVCGMPSTATGETSKSPRQRHSYLLARRSWLPTCQTCRLR